jgi:PII-like signaling protein
MNAPCEATLLRIFIGYDDTYDDKPLYDEIVLKARAMQMAGATVTRGIRAYGPASREQHFILRLSEDLPIVIEIVDSEEKIRAFMPVVDEMIDSGMMFTQKVAVARYGKRQSPGDA